MRLKKSLRNWKCREYLPGNWYTKRLFLEFWSRQRFFTNFQATLCDYWGGAATPFLIDDRAFLHVLAGRLFRIGGCLRMCTVDIMASWQPFQEPTPMSH